MGLVGKELDHLAGMAQRYRVGLMVQDILLVLALKSELAFWLEYLPSFEPSRFRWSYQYLGFL